MGGYRWVVLALMTGLQLGVSMPQQTPAAIGPVLIPALELSRPQLGLLTSAIWGGMLLGMLPAGILADRFGERPVIAGGTAVMAAFLLIAAQMSDFRGLFTALLLASLGAAASSPGGTKVVAAWFRVRQRGLALGVRQTGVTLAGVTAAVLLPPVVVRYGWPAAFRLVAVMALGATVAFVLLYREPAAEAPTGVTWSDLRLLLGNQTFLRATAYAWVFMGALASAVGYLGLSVHEGSGLSAVEAGRVLAVLQLGGIAGRIGWGALSDRMQRRVPAMILAGVLAAISSAAMALAHGHRDIVLLGVLAFLLGSSVMGWNALYITLASEAVPARAAASALGAGFTVSFTGMFIVAPIFGFLADLTGGYVLPWSALALWCAIGTAVGLGLREPAGPPAQATASVSTSRRRSSRW